jgi:hypothetical protein
MGDKISGLTDEAEKARDYLMKYLKQWLKVSVIPQNSSI